MARRRKPAAIVRKRPEGAGFVRSVKLERGADWAGTEHPYNLACVRGWEALTLHPKVTFLVGENGSGKSTLIEAIAIAYGFNPEGGDVNHRFATQDTHSPLHRHLRLVRAPGRPGDGFFLRAESFYNVATYLEEVGASRSGTRELHAMSHGESFWSIFDKRLTGDGFYVMDEPEAALSPQRQLAFLARLHTLVLENSQFLIATHAPILLGYPDALIYELSPDGLIARAYDELEHVRVTRQFLNRRETFLDVLLGDDA